MRRSRILIALPMLLLTAVPAAGQATARDLQGYLFDFQAGWNAKKGLPNVQLTIRGVATSTNDTGYFELRLPGSVQPGQDVIVREDREDYYILLPFRSELRVPAPNKEVELWMAPKGLKVVLGADVIERLVAFANEDLASQPKDPKAGAPDPMAYVNELAIQSGRPAKEFLEQIGRWAKEAKESDDPRKRALAASAEGNFHLAAQNFALAADAEERRGAESLRKSAEDRSHEGDSHSNALEFPKALEAYRKALKALGTYRDAVDDLRLTAYPEYANDVRDLTLKMANVKVNLGIRVDGSESQRFLNEAAQACQQVIDKSPRSQDPRGWARAQSNLANALFRLGERRNGPEALRYLVDATKACRAALEVYTHQVLPRDWAMTQLNLGNALSSLAVRQDGAEATRSLADAVTAYQAALEVYTRHELPQDWAAVQNNLGVALRDLSATQEGAEATRSLADAIAAYRAALEVYTRQTLPQRWAGTQINLGVTLSGLAERQEGAEATRSLADAVAACRAALEVLTRQALPQDWAMTHNNLSVTLRELARRQEGGEATQSLADAVAACRAALEVYTRQALPQDWAMTQNNLGNALSMLAGRQEGAEAARSLADAVAACRAALEVFTRQALPQGWAMIQDTLGTALSMLAERQEGAEAARTMADAVVAYRAALEVYTRQTLPQVWARTQNSFGLAVQMLALRERFFPGLERIDRLAGADGLRGDPVAKASLRALRVYLLAAGGKDAEAGRALAELVRLVEGQGGDFRLVWDWSPLRTALAESKDEAVVARREKLSQLLDTLKPGRDREALLADLRKLTRAFPAPGLGASGGK